MVDSDRATRHRRWSRPSRRVPGFRINGVRHEGRWELEELLPLIEAAAPAPPHDEAGPAPDVAADEVAEASWESFPASDAPGWRDHT
jgi:hypothetical protein